MIGERSRLRDRGSSDCVIGGLVLEAYEAKKPQVEVMKTPRL